ncbi:MAG: hypothetical protein L3K03_05905 [Thermoplasmata archaeon]|nr:hypothetical protein [Thermoplasmata archaeon]
MSALRKGLTDGLPFLFFGVVCFVVSYELFGSAAHFGNGSIPLWILPLAIGAIASGTGVVGAFTPENLPHDAVLAATVGKEYVVVPRLRWLEIQLQLLDNAQPREPASRSPTASLRDAWDEGPSEDLPRGIETGWEGVLGAATLREEAPSGGLQAPTLNPAPLPPPAGARLDPGMAAPPTASSDESPSRDEVTGERRSSAFGPEGKPTTTRPGETGKAGAVEIREAVVPLGASSGQALPPSSSSDWTEGAAALPDTDWTESRDSAGPSSIEPAAPVTQGRCSECRRAISGENPGGECTFCNRVLCAQCEEKSTAAGHPGLCSVCAPLVDGKTG